MIDSKELKAWFKRIDEGVFELSDFVYWQCMKDALLAAVELAEAADRYDSKDDALASTISSRRRDYARALEAYRAATQERRGS